MSRSRLANKAISRLLLGSVALTGLAAASAGAQVVHHSATATGVCSAAIAASGNSKNTINLNCYRSLSARDRQTVDGVAKDQQTIRARLTAGDRRNGRQDKKIDWLIEQNTAREQENAKLKETLALALNTINALAAQPGAVAAQQAKAMLAAHDVTGAARVIGQAADAQRTVGDNARADSVGLYVQQATLLRFSAPGQALAALEKALAIDPDNIAALDMAADTASLARDDAKSLHFAQHLVAVTLGRLAGRPDDAALLDQLQAGYFYIADAQDQLDNRADSVSAYRLALPILQKLHASSPDNRSWLARMIICYHAISNAEYARKDYQAALRNRALGLELNLTRAARDPAFQFSVVTDYRFMARIQKALGDRPAALSSYLSALAAASAAAGPGLEKDDWQNEIWEIYGDLAEYYGKGERTPADHDEALKYHGLRVDLARRVVAGQAFPSVAAELGLSDRADPWKRSLWSSLDDFATYLMRGKDDAAALPIVTEAIALAERAVNETPDDLEWRRKLLRSRTMLGKLQERAHQDDAALLTYNSVLTLAVRSLELSPDDPRSLVDLAGAYDNIALAKASSPDARKGALGKAIALHGRIAAGGDEIEAEYARTMLAMDQEALRQLSQH